MAQPSKRSRTGDDLEDERRGSAVPRSLGYPISPPRKRARQEEAPGLTAERQVPPRGGQTFDSPIQLTRIRDLPPEANVDTVTLKDVLGDPLIAECWEFNYLHDIDFLMSAFDEDVRHLVKVHVVHGFWKREDPSRLGLQVSRRPWPLAALPLPPSTIIIISTRLCVCAIPAGP